MAIGDDTLRDAVAYYMEWVHRVSVVGTGVPAQEWEAPLFTYLLTNKQFNALKAHCACEDWPPPGNRGITFYPSVIKHILTARQGKDSLICLHIFAYISYYLS